MLFPVDVPMSNSFLLKQGICQWPGCAQRNSSLRFYDMIGFARLVPNSPFGHFLPNLSGIFGSKFGQTYALLLIANIESIFS